MSTRIRSTKQFAERLWRLSHRRFNLLNVHFPSQLVPKQRIFNERNSHLWNRLAVLSSLLVGMTSSHLYSSLSNSFYIPSTGEIDVDETVLINWSGTHDVSTSRYFEPSSQEEAADLLRDLSAQHIPVRPVGSGLSPNGIAFSSSAMINMTQCNKIIHIDENSLQVTVEAGCTVQELVDGIRSHGITLQNIASIAQQQIGGFMQVGAHGTGATIPPCDMQIVAMKIATPENGIIHLSETENSELFYLARVGLDAFGAVTEVTVQCVPSHTLREQTFVLSHDEVERLRDELVECHRHVRFMWIPFTDSVVVVVSDPTDSMPPPRDHVGELLPNKISEDERLRPLSDLLRSVYLANGKTVEEANADIRGQSFSGIRDLLLAAGPGVLDTEHVRSINQAEARYWENCTGHREDTSDRVLSFDCGGQQWVYEICFPTGTNSHGDGRDVQFVRELLQIVEEEDIPAPSPIEQRWTGRSTSKLSPAFSENEDDVFSWVGIIMYMPTQDRRIRQHVTNEFYAYSQVLNRLCEKYGAVGHWAKIETQLLSRDERAKLQHRLGKRYKFMDTWKATQQQVDPNGIMLNDVVRDCCDF